MAVSEKKERRGQASASVLFLLALSIVAASCGTDDSGSAVGETDTGWISAMEEAVATLQDLGGDARLEIVAGEGHIITSLQDGIRVFNELDTARQIG